MHRDSIVWINFAVALGIGLLMGTERERNKDAGLEKSAEGVRTFALATLLGTVSAWMHFWLFLFSMACVMLFAAIASQKQSPKHPGITTEVALVFAMVLGGLCVEAPDLAAATAIVVVILLSAKQPIHGFVLRIVTQEDLNNFLILAASTLIILPLVPNAFIGPFDAINPRYLWLIVILVMLVSAISHIVIRFLDVRIGLPLVGFLSGFASSIATVTTMGKQAQDSPALLSEAIAGATFSSLATILQLTILLAVIDIHTLRQLMWPLLLGGLSITAYGFSISMSSFRHGRPVITPATNSFNATTALLLALFIGIVLIVSAALKSWFGQPGLVAISFIAGFADVHAPTIAVATLVTSGHLPEHETIVPILAAYSANATSKAVMAIMSGSSTFSRPVIIGLMAQVAAIWLGWLLF